MSVESEVLEQIRPSEEECTRIISAADDLKKITEDYLRSHGIVARVRYVGSVAKGTFLKDPDIDMFILFDQNVPAEDVERIGIEAGVDLIEGRMMYAEHPYTTGSFRGIDVDMVPCYDIDSTEHMMSAVDRTPFHADYIMNHADAEMRDQMRLTKKFMKGIGAYGAEPDIRGFSGYLCELLTLHYGGFRRLLEAASGWREGTVIVHEEKGPAMKGALVFYDPVDCRRNVASAVHIDTMCMFIRAAAEYLKSPDRKFFFPAERKVLSRDEIMSKAEDGDGVFVSVSFAKPGIIDENLQAQLWKTQYAICKKLDDTGYGTIRAVHRKGDEDVLFIFQIEHGELSKVHKHQGPPVWVASSENFLNRWRDNPYGAPFIEDGHWYVVSERLYRRVEDMLQKEVRNAGIGRDLDIGTMRIMDCQETLREADASALTELLDPRYRWEY